MAMLNRLTIGRYTELIDRFYAQAGVASGTEVNSSQAALLAELTSDVLYQLFGSPDAVMQQCGGGFLEFLIDLGWFGTLERAGISWDFSILRSIAVAGHLEVWKRAQLVSKVLRASSRMQNASLMSPNVANIATLPGSLADKLVGRFAAYPGALVPGGSTEVIVRSPLQLRDLVADERPAAPQSEVKCESCTYYDAIARFCAVEPLISSCGSLEEKDNCRSFSSP